MPANTRIALISDDMDQAKAAAEDLRARGFTVELMDDLPRSYSSDTKLSLNRQWIHQMMDEGVQVWDLGRAPWREEVGTPINRYYAMELQETEGYWNAWWLL